MTRGEMRWASALLRKLLRRIAASLTQEAAEMQARAGLMTDEAQHMLRVSDELRR